jgi:hypothetical protein
MKEERERTIGNKSEAAARHIIAACRGWPRVGAVRRAVMSLSADVMTLPFARMRGAPVPPDARKRQNRLTTFFGTATL